MRRTALVLAVVASSAALTIAIGLARTTLNDEPAVANEYTEPEVIRFTPLYAFAEYEADGQR